MKLVPGAIDQLMLFAIVALVAVGLVMVFSASSVDSMARYGDKFFFFRKQLQWALLGAVAMAAFTLLDYRQLDRYAVPLMGVAFVLLLLVFVPGVGKFIRGARRWVQLGIFGCTPSAVAEFALINYLAHSLAANVKLRENFREYVLPNLTVIACVFLLILKQPDFSEAVVIAGIGVLLITIAHHSLRNLGLLGLLGFLGVVFVTATDPMRLRRVTAFVDPWADPYGSGYHVIQSLLALGGGGLTGVGLGQSRQKFEYLPDGHTDFIFAVLGEELGFIGAALVLLLFGILVWRGIRASLAAPDLYGMLLGFGLTASVGLQSCLNVAVVVGSAPTTGVALPFMSYGGTSLVLFMSATGILLNLSGVGEREKQKRLGSGWSRGGEGSVRRGR